MVASLGLWGTIANAQETPFVGYCDNTDVIINTFLKPQGKQPKVLGVGNIHFTNEGTPVAMTLWVNQSDMSWTIVATPSADVSCIVMYGVNLGPFPPQQ